VEIFVAFVAGAFKSVDAEFNFQEGEMSILLEILISYMCTFKTCISEGFVMPVLVSIASISPILLPAENTIVLWLA
jgi:hypothetical protein